MRFRTGILTKWLTSVIVCASVPVSAQWLNYPDPRIPRTKDGKPNLSAPAPRTRDSTADLSGVWKAAPTPLSEIEQVVPHFGDLQIDERVTSKYILNVFWGLRPEQEPLKPDAAAVMRQQKERDSTSLNCLPAGLPFVMFIAPFKIIQAPAEITMLFEHQDPPRQIYTDGRPLPKDPEPAWIGYSSGKWQRDTLVIETVGFNDKATLDGFGHPRSESLHMTERFHRRDFGHMDIEMTFNDPKYYTRPFSVNSQFNLIPDSDVLEYVCGENEKDRVHVK